MLTAEIVLIVLSNYETADITTDAQKILSCIARTGQRFGKKMIIDILRGSKNARLLSLGLDKQSTYGLMSEQTEKRVRDIVDYLDEKGYIIVDGSEYPVLKLTSASYNVLHGNISLQMKIAKQQKKKLSDTGDSFKSTMLDALKQLRKKIAAKQNVPAYIVFSDATLMDMCKKCPRTPDEFIGVSGVGKAKLDKYGKEFIDTIAGFDGENDKKHSE